MSVSKVLITGATGGLGGALLREAGARGWSIRATGRSALHDASVEFIPADLAAPAADLAPLVEGCDTVIHAAALSASWGSAEAFERANVLATQRLLAAAQAAGVARFTFVSSPSIFARLRDQVGITEATPPAEPALNHYARTKLAAERMVLAAGRDTFATCAIRPRALVGEGDRVIMPRLIEIAQRPRVPFPRGGRALIEMTDLRDVAWAVCEAAERCEAISGKAVNISGGKPMPVAQVAQAVADAIGTSPKLVDLPVPVATALATVLEYGARAIRSAKEPPITRYTLSTMAYSQTFDLAGAKAMLGYEPRYDALQTLLAEVRKTL